MWTDLFNNHIYIYITIICVQITYCVVILDTKYDL
jgi:hypothetical protein